MEGDVRLLQAKRWRYHPEAPAAFLQTNHEHPTLLQVLYNRGVRDAAAVTDFLRGKDAVQEDPTRLAGVTAATERIVRAIERKEIICVYGDFDADGVTATALLVEALQAAGARVGAYIPDRVDEGYGLNVESIQERIAPKADLLVTVDCGIRSVAEVAAAVAMGLDVIVTDHHSIGRELPPALAVINPRRADNATFEQLAGVGVAFRLAQAVLRAVVPARAEELEASLLDLVALGTVADLMPLVDENRWLVKRGLAQIQRGRRAGLFALMEWASLQPQTVDSSAISYRLAPRINAAGRLQHAKIAYNLLRVTEYAQAYDQAARLEQLNRERQRLTRAALQEADGQLASLLDSDPALLFVASESFQPGIVGLVAGRLVDRFYRPAVVVEKGETESRGSARSIEEFDVTAALDEVSDLLVRHGGHSRAAGFTVTNERLPDLMDALSAIAIEQLARHDDLRPTLWIDAELGLDAINWALHSQLCRLEPCGQANEPALFLSRDCRVRGVRTVGKDGKHLKLSVDGNLGTPVFDAIGFGLGERARDLDEGSRIDLVYRLEMNEWNGRRSLQLNVQDLRPADEATS